GIFYAQGVKANVLFFDRKPGSDTPWTKELWIYDLRTNQHFTLKTNPLRRADLDDFVVSYKPGRRGEREESERFRRFTYDELVARDKASLDIFWLRDESQEDTDNLPAPGVIAAEIVEDLQAALAEYTELAESLQGIGVNVESEELVNEGHHAGWYPDPYGEHQLRYYDGSGWTEHGRERHGP